MKVAFSRSILSLVCTLASIAMGACTDVPTRDRAHRDAMADSGEDILPDAGQDEADVGPDAQPDGAGDHINGEPNTGRLGADQCPLRVDRTCPDGCTEISGAVVDVEAECKAAPRVVDCTTLEGFPDEVDCRVSSATGDVFSIPFLALGGKGFLGWRECSEKDRLVAINAPRCQ